MRFLSFRFAVCLFMSVIYIRLRPAELQIQHFKSRKTESRKLEKQKEHAPFVRRALILNHQPYGVERTPQAQKGAFPL